MTKTKLEETYEKTFEACKKMIKNSNGAIYKWEKRNSKEDKLVSRKSWKEQGICIVTNQRYENDKSIGNELPKDMKEIEESIQEMEELALAYKENIAIQEELEQERIERLMKIVGGI